MNAPLGATYLGWGPNTVVISAADFENGRLPGICAVTGAPATANLERRYGGTPRWIGWLFLINWMALAIAYLFTHQRAIGRLPVTSSIAVVVERRQRIGSLLFGAAIIAWLVTAIVAIVVGGTAGAIVVTTGLMFGAVAFAASIVMTVMESAALGIRGKVSKDGFGTRWVQLRGVHPAFVQAVVSSRP